MKNKWLRVEQIAQNFNMAIAHVKTFIERGNIRREDLQFRPLKVYMTDENISKFSALKDTKYQHKKSKDYVNNWNLTTYNCYKSNYDCDNCIVKNLESLTKCNIPKIIEELLINVGEPPEPHTKEYNRLMGIIEREDAKYKN